MCTFWSTCPAWWLLPVKLFLEPWFSAWFFNVQTPKSLVIKSVSLYNKVEFSDNTFLPVTSCFIVLTPRSMCSGPQFPRKRISDLMSCIWVCALSFSASCCECYWKLIWWTDFKSDLYHNAFLSFPFPKQLVIVLIGESQGRDLTFWITRLIPWALFPQEQQLPVVFHLLIESWICAHAQASLQDKDQYKAFLLQKDYFAFSYLVKS